MLAEWEVQPNVLTFTHKLRFRQNQVFTEPYGTGTRRFNSSLR